MEHLLKAMQTIVTDSVGMDPRMRREFNQLIKEGYALDAATRVANAVERAKIDNARLPECAGFAGEGRRCAACKIHKNVHA